MLSAPLREGMHSSLHAPADLSATVFVCPVCGESFASQAILDAHYRGMGQVD